MTLNKFQEETKVTASGLDSMQVNQQTPKQILARDSVMLKADTVFYPLAKNHLNIVSITKLQNVFAEHAVFPFRSNKIWNST